MYTNQPISCTEPTSTPCCIPRVKMCCIQPDILVFPQLPDWNMQKRVCHFDFDQRIRKLGREGISKQTCEDACYSDPECKFYAVSNFGACNIYRSCDKKRNT